MKRMIIAAIGLTICIAPYVAASVITWNNHTGDQVWTNALNWGPVDTTDNLPGPADEAAVNEPWGDHPIFATGTSETVNLVSVGRANALGGMVMTGGMLTVGSHFHVNTPANANHMARFDMSGGTLDVSSNFRVGMNDNTAEFNMSGGTIYANAMNIGPEAEVVFTAGIIDINNNLAMDAGATFDIWEGSLLIVRNTNREAQIQGYIDNGYLFAQGGAGNWSVNMINDGNTLNITAIPEPATIGLLMISGIGLLALRRRKAC